MTRGIKDSGLSQHQADAIVNAVAIAVQEVSVTPELLDDRLARQDRKFEGRISELRDDLRGQFSEHKQETRALITEHKNDTNLRFDGVDKRLDSIDAEIRKLHDSVQGSHRTQLRYFIGFMSATLASALGIIGSILST